jgi:hypothetical protein
MSISGIAMHQYSYLEALAYISSILLHYIQLLTYGSAKYTRPISPLPMLKGKLYLVTCPTLAQRSSTLPTSVLSRSWLIFPPGLCCCQPKYLRFSKSLDKVAHRAARKKF